MPVVFMNSYAHFTTTAQADTKVAQGQAPVAGTGAFSDYGIRPRGGALGEMVNLASALATIEVSWYAKLGAQYGKILEWWETSGVQCTLEAFSDGTFKFCRGGQSAAVSGGSGTILGASNPGAVAFNEQHHFLARVVFSQTVGTFLLNVDGVTVLTLSGLDNCLQAAANTTQLRFHGDGSNNTADQIMSHLAIADTSGDITGQPRVEALFPDGAGNYSAWTPTAGANYTNVDETTPNDDTDYVASSTVAQRDSYTYSNMLGAAATILAVALVPRIRKDDAVARTVKRFVRAGGVDYDGAAVAVPATYGYLQEILAVNPATGLAWTPAEVNAIEAGIKVES